VPGSPTSGVVQTRVDALTSGAAPAYSRPREEGAVAQHSAGRRGEAMKTVRGKVALVTGAASGIGRAVALALAREGAALHLLDVDEDGRADVVDEARRLGSETVGCRCDLSRPDEVSEAVRGVLDRWGELDILVNNAGVAYYGPTERMTAEQWDWLLSVNLLA